VPNILANPRYWKNKAVLIKSEAAYGVSSVPTGAADWIEARNFTITPMDTDKVARNIDLPYMGNSGDIIVSEWAKITFDVAIAPSGAAGTAPKWAPLLMACGTAETIVAVTSAAYNLIKTAFSSVSALINIDGVVHELLGMRGEVKGKMSAKGTPMLSFAFDALYVAPVTGDLPAVTRTGWMIEEGVNSINTLPLTLNAIPLAFSMLDWGHGNKIARIDLPGPQKEIGITDRAPTASATVLAPALGVFNPFALADAATVVTMSTTHGSAAGKKFKLDMNVRVIDVAYDKIDDQAAYKLTLQPIPVAGNDEIAYTCL
jgi:hypothetical protein